MKCKDLFTFWRITNHQRSYFFQLLSGTKYKIFLYTFVWMKRVFWVVKREVQRPFSLLDTLIIITAPILGHTFRKRSPTCWARVFPSAVRATRQKRPYEGLQKGQNPSRRRVAWQRAVDSFIYSQLWFRAFLLDFEFTKRPKRANHRQEEGSRRAPSHPRSRPNALYCFLTLR